MAVRVALYARVSTDEQVQGYGLGAQMDALRGEATRRAYEIAEEFRDEGWSGASVDRPAMNRLREAARAHLFDVVLFPTLDRLARSIGVQAYLLDQFKKMGIKVEFVSMQVEDTKESRLQLTVLGGIAEYEREAIRDRFSYGRRRKAVEGSYVRPWYVAFGWEPDPSDPTNKVRICERHVQLMRGTARAMLLEGKSLRLIADEFERLIPAKRGKWGESTIRQILTNERYLGTVYYGKTRIVDGKRVKGHDPVPIQIPAIWTREEIEEHKALLAKNRNDLVGRPSEFKYPLREYANIRCATCGARYDGCPSRHEKRYYRHQKKTKCRGPWLDAELAETRAWLAIHKALQDPAWAREQAYAYEAARGAGVVDIASREAPYKAKIAEREKKVRRLEEAIEHSDEPVASLMKRRNELRRELDQLRAELAAVQADMARTDPPIDVDALITQVQKALSQMTDVPNWDIVQDLVDEIRVWPDRTLEIVGHIGQPGNAPVEAGKSSRRTRPRACPTA